ncbi:unnamed protein product [Ectocarpus fasciculatus]
MDTPSTTRWGRGKYGIKRVASLQREREREEPPPDENGPQSEGPPRPFGGALRRRLRGGGTCTARSRRSFSISSRGKGFVDGVGARCRLLADDSGPAGEHFCCCRVLLWFKL